MGIQEPIAPWEVWDGSEERRIDERSYLALNAVVRREGFETSHVVVINMSPHGLAFTGFEPFRPGDKVDIIFRNKKEFSAIVIRDDGIRTGCRFTRPLTTGELKEVTRLHWD